MISIFKSIAVLRIFPFSICTLWHAKIDSTLYKCNDRDDEQRCLSKGIMVHHIYLSFLGGIGGQCIPMDDLVHVDGKDGRGGEPRIEEWPLRRRLNKSWFRDQLGSSGEATSCERGQGRAAAAYVKVLACWQDEKNFVGKGLAEIAADGRGHPLLSCMASRICSEPQLKKGSNGGGFASI